MEKRDRGAKISQPVAFPKPNFFIVGAPRCGTTALHGFLAQHPDVFMTESKEPHYFCSDLRDECDTFHRRERYFPYRTPEQYLGLFAGADGESVRGESSVYYLYSKTAPQEIFAFDPDAKIIIMVREPVAFLQSLHAKLRYMGDEDRATLAEAMALEERRKQGLDVPRTVRMPSFLYYSDAARFSGHIQRYRDVFPEQNLRTLVLDDLKSDEERVLGEVQDFLGVERRALPPPDTLNPNQEARWRAATLLQRALEAKVEELGRDPNFLRRRLMRVLPFKVLRRLSGYVDRLNSRRAERRPLDEAVRRELRDRCRPEVEQLGAMLGRDLVELWGYDASPV